MSNPLGGYGLNRTFDVSVDEGSTGPMRSAVSTLGRPSSLEPGPVSY